MPEAKAKETERLDTEARIVLQRRLAQHLKKHKLSLTSADQEDLVEACADYVARTNTGNYKSNSPFKRFSSKKGLIKETRKDAFFALKDAMIKKGAFEKHQEYLSYPKFRKAIEDKIGAVILPLINEAQKDLKKLDEKPKQSKDKEMVKMLVEGELLKNGIPKGMNKACLKILVKRAQDIIHPELGEKPKSKMACMGHIMQALQAVNKTLSNSEAKKRAKTYLKGLNAILKKHHPKKMEQRTLKGKIKRLLTRKKKTSARKRTPVAPS